MFGPAEEHLCATVGDVVITEISRMHAANIDEVSRHRAIGLVKDFFVGPWMLQDLFNVVVFGGGITAFSVWWNDGAGCLEVAVVESIVNEWNKVDHDECLVMWRVDEVEVHDFLLDQERRRGWGQLTRGPTLTRPVLVLEKSSVSSVSERVIMITH